MSEEKQDTSDKPLIGDESLVINELLLTPTFRNPKYHLLATSPASGISLGSSRSKSTPSRHSSSTPELYAGSPRFGLWGTGSERSGGDVRGDGVRGEFLDEVDVDVDPKISTISTRAWISGLVGICAMLVSGVNYAFSAWSDDFKRSQSYTQSEIQLIGALGNVGQYFGPLAGIIFDIFGTRISCYLAAVLSATGFVVMYLTEINVTPFFGIGAVQGVFYFLASFGTQILYLTALAANIQIFPETYRGLVVGLLVAVYGLCATVYTGIYNAGFDQLSGFLLFMGISIGVVAFLSGFGLHDTGGHVAEQESLNNDKDKVSPWRRVCSTLKEKLIDPTYWLIFFTFFFGVGAGLLHINNIGQLTTSLNGGLQSEDQVFICVTIVSVSNALGRFFAGFTDFSSIKRGWFLVGSIFIMSLSHLIAALIFVEDSPIRIYILTVTIGLTYGMQWSLTPTITSELWGANNFAQNWGWVLVSAAFTSYAYNGAASYIYQSQIPYHPSPYGENDCLGRACYRNAYFMSAGLSACGLITGTILATKTRPGYLETTPSKTPAIDTEQLLDVETSSQNSSRHR